MTNVISQLLIILMKVYTLLTFLSERNLFRLTHDTVVSFGIHATFVILSNVTPLGVCCE